MDRKVSQALFDEAQKYFPGGVNSPVRAFKSVEGPPVFVKSGKGAYIRDEDENEFLDFCCSWGPLILGHADNDILEFLHSTLDRGTSFGTPTRLGNQLGDLICSHHNYFDQIRFVSSGTEAVMSAVRLARGITGKNHIVKFEGCYHGHVDSLMVKAGSGLATFGTGSSDGIPQSLAELTIVLPLDDEEALDSCFKKYADQLAAVIIEPIPANNGLLIQRPEFLRTLRQKCTEYGVLLIFDEVISGFRIGFEGAAGFYDIQPDLLTYGKIIGGGMPVGAFAGPRKYMKHIAPEGTVYQAGTLSANPIAMAAGYASLKKLLSDHFYEDLERKTKLLTDGLQDYITEKDYPAGIQQMGSIFWLKFSRDTIRTSADIDSQKMELFKQLHSYLLHNGIYLGPSGYEVGFVSAAHSDQDMQKALHWMRKGLDHLKFK